MAPQEPARAEKSECEKDQGKRQIDCSQAPKVAFRLRPWHSSAQGFASTGVVGVPFDKSTMYRDLVVTNGNDRAPRPIAIYRNQKDRKGSAFLDAYPYPQWTSRETAMHGSAAAGDIDGDGIPDLVVAVMRDHPEVDLPNGTQAFYPGGVDVYLAKHLHRDGTDCTDNVDCIYAYRLTAPRIGRCLGTSSVALGDIDGDGWLDLVVAPAYEKFASDNTTCAPQELPTNSIRWSTLTPSKWQVYFNHGGKFDQTPGLVSEDAYYSGAVKLADVNEDQYLDLVVGSSSGVSVFLGKPNGSSRTISDKPEWTFPLGCTANCDLTMAFVSSLDAATGSDPNHLQIAAATSCLHAPDGCYGGYQIIHTGPDSLIETKPFVGWAGQVRLRRMDRDDVLDLVTAPWWEYDSTQKLKKTTPGIYFGDDPNTLVPLVPNETPYVAEGIALADFTCEAVTAHSAPPSTKTGVLVNLPDRYFEAVVRVAVATDANGQILEELKPPKANWVVGEPWVMISDKVTLQAGQSIHIDYTESREPDVAIGSWDYDHGVTVYERNTIETDSSCLN